MNRSLFSRQPRPWGLTLLALAALAAGKGFAAEPVTVEVQPRCSIRTSVITVGDVAALTGGDPVFRDQVARLDVADLKAREQSLTISRRAIEYRLQLAGIDPARVRVVGVDRVAVTADKRTITADEVVAAARAEVFRWLSVPRESVTVELARPVVVQLPEAPAAEAVTITAVPHVKPVGLGRIQMDVVIATTERPLLAVGVDLEVRSINSPSPAGTRTPTLMNPAPRSMPIQPNGRPQPPLTLTDSQRTSANSGRASVDGAATPNPMPSNAVVPAVATQPFGAPNSVMQASAANPTPSSAMQAPASPPIDPTVVLVHARERVAMQVHSGLLSVSAVGEAQQDGRFGQTVMVQNIDSKKAVIAKVIGPGTVEIEVDR